MPKRSNLLIWSILLIACSELGAQQPSLPDATVSAEAGASAELSVVEQKLTGKDLAGARAALEAYLAKHPNDARGLFDLGYLEESSEHHPQAKAAYSRAIAADPKQFEAQLALGLLLAREGLSDEARSFVEAATQLDPSPANPTAKARSWRALAQLDRTSDPTRAKYALLEALKISPETSEDTLLTAEIAEASDDLETAEAAYRQVLTSHPDSSAATAGLVHLLLKTHKYDEAEPLLRSALLRDPDDPALNSQLAATLLGEKKPADASAVLVKTHELQPSDSTVTRMLAETLILGGDYAKAAPLYSELLLRSPEDADLLTRHGECLLHLQKYGEAVTTYEHALRLKPDDGDAWGGLAFASSELKQYTTTLKALSMRSKYIPDTPASFFLWAITYDNLHQLKAASEYYQKFLTAAQGNFPDQEWQAKHRLIALGKH